MLFNHSCSSMEEQSNGDVMVIIILLLYIIHNITESYKVENPIIISQLLKIV